MTEQKKRTIQRGDIVRIRAMGRTRVGTVLSVQKDWNTDEYGLEIRSEDHGYVYWKQWTDGGTVEVLQTLPLYIPGTNVRIIGYQQEDGKYRADVFELGSDDPLMQGSVDRDTLEIAMAVAEEAFYREMERLSR